MASVRPMISNPLAIRASSSQTGSGGTRLLIPAGRAGSGLKPGVSLQQIQTTTGMLLSFCHFIKIIIAVESHDPINSDALQFSSELGSWRLVETTGDV